MPSNPKVEAPLALVQEWTLSAAATLGSSVRAKVRYARAPHMSTNAAVALLLEDEPQISMDLEQTLQGAGFDVTTVISCAEAEECLAAHQPSQAPLFFGKKRGLLCSIKLDRDWAIAVQDGSVSLNPAENDDTRARDTSVSIIDHQIIRPPETKRPIFEV